MDTVRGSMTRKPTGNSLKHTQRANFRKNSLQAGIEPLCQSGAITEKDKDIKLDLKKHEAKTNTRTATKHTHEINIRGAQSRLILHEGAGVRGPHRYSLTFRSWRI